MTWTRRAESVFTARISFGRMVVELAGLIALWRGRVRQRRALKKLDERLLRDIGIGRIEAENETRKRFWQP